MNAPRMINSTSVSSEAWFLSTSAKTYFEEGLSGARPKTSILNGCLFRQIFNAFNGRYKTFHSEERSQVGGVGRDHDQSEEPPHAGCHPSRESSAARKSFASVSIATIETIARGCERAHMYY